MKLNGCMHKNQNVLIFIIQVRFDIPSIRNAKMIQIPRVIAAWACSYLISSHNGGTCDSYTRICIISIYDSNHITNFVDTIVIYSKQVRK